MTPFYDMYEGSDKKLSLAGIDCAIATLRPQFEAEVLDMVFEGGQESLLATMSLEEQLSHCRFSAIALENPLCNRKFNNTPSACEDLRRVFDAGYPIGKPHVGHIWCALTTHGGVFLGFFVDGNDILYIGDTVGFSSIDTTGDNNGAGYKGGEDGPTSSLSLVIDPDLRAVAGATIFAPRPEERTAAHVTVPAGTLEIAPFAFRNCTSLVSISLPEGLKKINRHAFEGCTALTEITLPASLEELDFYAFAGCTSLTALALPAGICEVPKHAFHGCSSLTSISLPAVTHVMAYAFMECTALAEIQMPKVCEFGSFAFCQCNGLTELCLSDTVKVLGFGCFQECSSLIRVTLPASIEEMDSFILNRCDNLCEVVVPAAIVDKFLEEMDGAWKGEPADGTMRDFWDDVTLTEV